MKKSKYELGLPHWKIKQRKRFQEILEAQDRGECKVAYWNSDAHGFPANHDCKDLKWRVEPGKIQEIEGPLELCSSRALHATMEPHRWKGSKVWIVALWGEVREIPDKLGALKREVVGEILPHEAFNESVGARLGRKDLAGADLSGANLSGANLAEANLSRANLYAANLIRSDLDGANLFRANLSGAYLAGSDLSRAYLFGANLSGAVLTEADLTEADLTGANLSGAYLSGADLTEADLTEADLTGANLSGPNLTGANLYRANVGFELDIKIDGWKNINGYLERE